MEPNSNHKDPFIKAHRNACFSKRRALFVGFKFVALFILTLGVSTTSRAQATLSASSNGASVSEGGTLYIDRTPSMPPLTLQVAGVCSPCSVHYTISIDWTGAGGQQTYASTYGDFSCDSSASVDWSSFGFAGGSAAITWDVYNGDSGGGTFTFNIKGTNPYPSQVNAMASDPWFFENMIAWESGAWNRNPTGIYHQFDASGYPLNCNCPNGIGLAQIDPPSSNNDFWNWSGNLTHGLNILNSKHPGATNHWNTQLAQMLADTSPNYVNPPSTYHTYCAFQYPQNGADSYADGDWIKAYNGNYFIRWHSPVAPNPGFWTIGSTSATDQSPNYVRDVCNSAAAH